MKSLILLLLTSTLCLYSSYSYADNSSQDHAIKLKGAISETDKNIIIKQCSQTWQRYRTALSKGAIEEALKNVSNKSKEEFRAILQYQGSAVELGDIKAEDIKDNIARFSMPVKTRLRPGDSIVPGYSIGDSIVVDGYVVFIKESDGSWKIDFY